MISCVWADYLKKLIPVRRRKRVLRDRELEK